MDTAAGSFLNLRTADQVRALLARFPPVPGGETLAASDAAGRVLLADLSSPESLPQFARASMDGWAVRAADTFGASEGTPALLAIRGQVPMGQLAPATVEPGTTVAISTGGSLPAGADAVVMLEYGDRTGTTVEIQRPVGVGEHLVQVGDDVAAGDVVAAAGRRLGAADLALVAAVGCGDVTVRRRPRVAILSTGDELVPPDERPGPAQVRDVNRVALTVQVARVGGEPRFWGLVPDEPTALARAVSAAAAESDVVLVSGGSSAGTRDHTRAVLDQLGPPGVLVHGVAVAPGKPTIVAAAGDVPILGLPGYPVSSLIIFELFVAGLIERLGGVDEPPPPFGRRRRARMSRQVASKPGREDWIRVRLETAPGGGLPSAVPVRGGTAALSSVTAADGVVRIDRLEEGLDEGADVEVCLWP